MALADLAVDFDCTIPATQNGFDCNLLQQEFFKAHPFFKELKIAEIGSKAIKITVGRVPVLNGFDYSIAVSRKGVGEESAWKEKKFLSDGVNPISAIQQINTVAQRGALSFAKLTGKPAIKDKQVIATYIDPAADEEKPDVKADGKWIIQPSLSFSYDKKKDLPSAIQSFASARFNYSGDRDRLVLRAGGSYNRIPTAVSTVSGPQFFGVNTYGGGGGGMIVTGLDKKNHWNFGSTLGGGTDPLHNIVGDVKAKMGVEYNVSPFLKEDSKTLALGCAVGPSYYAFETPNLLDRKQFVGLEQSCHIVASLLLDKKRGTTVSATVGENWIVTAPDYVSVDGKLNANIRVTDRLSLMPTATLSMKTKAISMASSKYAPDFSSMDLEDKAQEQVKAQARAGLASTFTYGGSLSISYTFGDGVNRANQDQRGVALH